jgi:AAA+ ATPase superfamily predicted ATPase
MEIQTGGFLDRLENEYGLIKKVRPVLAKPNSRSVKYTVEDNFLSFWFRFIYKYRSTVEAGNLEYLKDIILRDYNTYSGKILEKYFIDKLKSEKKYNLIGTYWEKQNQNEIDIVAINDTENKVLFAEVKRNSKKISIEKLKEKSENLVKQYKDYKVEYKAYSLDDM